MSKILMPDGGLVTPQGTVPTGKDISAAIAALEVIDPDTIEPIEFRVLLRITDAESITSGGIFKPASVLEKEIFGKCTAEVAAIGAEAFTNADGSPLKAKPKIGDKVVIAKYSGLTMRDKNFNLFRFSNDKDVVAIVKE